uniref:CBM39 domain-containing protein n=1 Tax=Anopheles dirus TaxID=7168 RepID=A0A182NEX2_9DIPT
MRLLLGSIVISFVLGLTKAELKFCRPNFPMIFGKFKAHIQLREPSGLMIWTSNSPLIETFGVELYVGRGNPCGLHKIVWDRKLLLNTSVITDGKFIIQADEIVVQRGETILYRYSVFHEDTVWQSFFRILSVTDDLFYRPERNVCYSQCPVEQNNPHMGAARLKDILERKIEKCAGLQASKHLLFPLENANKFVADPLTYIQDKFRQVESLRPLVDNVVTADLTNNGVGFRMRTLIDKFKVLELGKYQLDVIDPDADSTEEATTIQNV